MRQVIPSSIEEVIAQVRPGHRIFVQGAAATPRALLRELIRQAPGLRDVELIHIHTEGSESAGLAKLREHFRVISLFVGPNLRPLLDYDGVDYLPCFLSEIPALFRLRKRPIDVALISVSPSDRHGFHTLGTSVDIARAATEVAPIILAQVNSKMPRVNGDGLIHCSQLTAFCEVQEDLPSITPAEMGTEEVAIGNHIASLIEDGSCIQVGIGAIPNAALSALRSHKHLGVHTEMASDGFLPLLHSGVIDNSRKRVHRGKTVSSFLLGSRALYDFVDDNPSVVLLGADYVNNAATIARNDRVVAINSAVEIDLTGQVCADSVGHRIVSGVGGQMDFMRGAALSAKGKAIIAVTSRTRSGKSRIVADLAVGAGIVTTRAHVQFVVTEYGIADLVGKTLGERARELISIAHPDAREGLTRAWRERLKYGKAPTKSSDVTVA